jgi:tRNA(adenine34) deaminase
MWDTLSEAWKLCIEMAWESYCQGSVPVGAAIFDANDQLLALGRNRALEDPAGEGRQIAGVTLAHAELNALLELDYASSDQHTCRLYTTVEPCPLCIGAITMAGLKEIHYASRDPWAGSVNLLHASPYMRWKSIRAFGPQEGSMEVAMFCLGVDNQIRRAHPRLDEVLAAWQREVPDGVRFGRAAHEDGMLDRLRKQGAAAQEAMTWIYDFMASQASA